MTKVKVTLSIDKVIRDLARQRNINMSLLLEHAIAIDLRIRKVVTYIQEIEQY